MMGHTVGDKQRLLCQSWGRGWWELAAGKSSPEEEAFYLRSKGVQVRRKLKHKDETVLAPQSANSLRLRGNWGVGAEWSHDWR